MWWGASGHHFVRLYCMFFVGCFCGGQENHTSLSKSFFFGKLETSTRRKQKTFKFSVSKMRPVRNSVMVAAGREQEVQGLRRSGDVSGVLYRVWQTSRTGRQVGPAGPRGAQSRRRAGARQTTHRMREENASCAGKQWTRQAHVGQWTPGRFWPGRGQNYPGRQNRPGQRIKGVDV